MLLKFFLITFFILMITEMTLCNVLYDVNDAGITILNEENFETFINENGKIKVIEFFHSWCGHCIRFAPKWRGFAKDVKGWSNLVKIGVIDCAVEKNGDICRECGIEYFPSIFFFTSDFLFGKSKPIKSHFISNTAMRKNIINFLTKEYNQHKYKNWPQLNSLSSELMDIPKLIVPGKANLLIIETENSTMGREIMLDLSRYSSYVNILTTNDVLTISKKFPVILVEPNLPMLIELNIQLKLVLKSGDMNEPYRGFIKMFIEKNYIPKNALLPQNDETIKTTTFKPVFDFNTDLVYLSDFYKCLRYTLFQQIPIHSEISGAKLEILKRFFNIISLYFPFNNQSAQNFIELMKSWLSTKIHHLNVTEYVEILQFYNNISPLPNPKEWKTCRGSELKFRGYPCSLWLTFHTLTVNEYLKFSSSLKFGNFHEVLYTMNDYIFNFFSCTECAKNFHKMAETLEDELIFPNSSVLWLWSAHNRANKRLAGDLTEDPYFPKVQFPPQNLCSNCYYNSKFVNSSVFSFLINRYKSVNLIGYNTSDESSYIIPGSWPAIYIDRDDISLCFIIYVIVSLFLLAICFVLNFRKKVKRDVKLTLLS